MIDKMIKEYYKKPKTAIARTRLVVVLRLITAFAFLFAGFGKVLGRYQMVILFEEIGFGQWLRFLVGVLEVLFAASMFHRRYFVIGAFGLMVFEGIAVAIHWFLIGGPVWPAGLTFFINFLILYLASERRSLTNLADVE